MAGGKVRLCTSDHIVPEREPGALQVSPLHLDGRDDDSPVTANEKPLFFTSLDDN